MNEKHRHALYGIAWALVSAVLAWASWRSMRYSYKHLGKADNEE